MALTTRPTRRSKTGNSKGIAGNTEGEEVATTDQDCHGADTKQHGLVVSSDADSTGKQSPTPATDGGNVRNNGLT